MKLSILINKYVMRKREQQQMVELLKEGGKQALMRREFMLKIQT